MSQAVAQTPGLPVPDTEVAPAPPSADDLLSKMAGDEIDRLLADAGEGSASPAAAPASQPPGASVSSLPNAEEAVVRVEAPAAGAVGGTTAPAGQTGAEAAVQAELDTLFAELTGKPGDPSGDTPSTVPAAVTPLEATAPAADNPQATEELPSFDAVPESPDLGPTVADSGDATTIEMSALEAELRETMSTAPAPVAGKTLDAPTPAPAATEERPTVEGPVGLLLRPLEWINAPLEALAPGARETVGKIAIITAFNAIVVLAYVLFFRGG